MIAPLLHDLAHALRDYATAAEEAVSALHAAEQPSLEVDAVACADRLTVATTALGAAFEAVAKAIDEEHNGTLRVADLSPMASADLRLTARVLPAAGKRMITSYVEAYVDLAEIVAELEQAS